MNILVACEESQEVCKAFRNKGHNAYSCDILECSGGKPEWHILDDVTKILKGECNFTTENGDTHYIDKWDMVLAFPPCTHLAVSGARHFEIKRKDGRQEEAIRFFGMFLNCDAKYVAIENPVGIISGNYIIEHFNNLCKEYNLPREYSQKIQPYEYGHNSKKTTCLWLKNLPLLKPTNIVKPDLITYTCKDGREVTFSRDYCQGVSKDRARQRSKTYTGIAEAMAEQWGDLC